MNCSIDGCAGKVVARGWCFKHYQRWRRHGSPHYTEHTAPGEKLAWLMSKVAHEDDVACLTWPYAKGDDGRGYVTFRGATSSSSRVMCILAHGEPPSPDLDSAHSCGKGHLACVNPHHLRWDTRKGNMADKVLHGTDPVGVRNGRAVLSPDAVRRIRRLGRGAVRHIDLAGEYGVDVSLISLIVNRKRWGSVE